ncbi:phage minor capsid protein [Streptosporangium sp. NPDC049078]|uniref:phage minor capsid protein n=1 Tax=Streptosporangium sp. NPDC049078 TaxID=3155767 RepID=UPI00342EB567
MAVDQDLLDQIAGTIADLYREVESSLVKVIADELRKGLDAPTAEVKLDAIRRLRAAAVAVQQRLAKTKSAAVREAVRTAYRSGTASALTSIPTDMLTRIRAKEAMLQVPNAALMENLAQALHRDLGRVEGNILRAPEDAYRAVQAATAARIATSTATRRQASQAAWQRLMDQGIASFTDSRGRRWRLSSYAEMIGRTNIARAAVQGQMDRLASIGLDLVYVSDNSQECKRCRPFESKVLRRDSGPIGKIRVEHSTRDGELVTVDVLDTLDGARAKGLFHPNCRHSASAYLPGVTKLKANTADPEGDKARQKQRALERKIRAAKERELGALDETAKKQARADVSDAQAQLRAHLKANPKLKRLPYREQIGAGNHPGPGGPKGGAVSDLTPPAPGTGPAPKAKKPVDPAKKAAAATAKADKAAAEKAAQEAAEQAAEQAEAERLAQEAAAREAAEKAEAERLAQEAKKKAEAATAEKAKQAAKKKPPTAAKPGKKVGVDARNAVLREGDDVTVSGKPGRVIGKGKYGAIKVEVDGQERDVSPADVRAVHGAEASKASEKAAAAAATAAKVKKLEDLYGNRLRIQKGSQAGPKHAEDFTKIPDAFHDALAAHVRGVDLGDGAIPDFMPELRGVQPRGWAPGKTWDAVTGAYDPTSRRVMVGSGHGHGSTSVCVHETGHALDHALGRAASSPEWRSLHADAVSHGVSPYYAQAGEAGRQEMWAEAFAAWTMHRDKPAAMRDMEIGLAMGLPSRKRVEVGGRLSAYFDNLLAKEES